MNASNQEIYSEQRTSSSISFKHGADSVISGIERRAADILHLTPDHIEPLQLVHYTKGASFDLHHDAADELDIFVQPKRIATYFVYLNDLPTETGLTVFPEIDLQIQPKKGMAVLWLNVHHDVNYIQHLNRNDSNEFFEKPEVHDKRLNHFATAVYGDLEKFGLNIWVLEKPFPYPVCLQH